MEILDATVRHTRMFAARELEVRGKRDQLGISSAKFVVTVRQRRRRE